MSAISYPEQRTIARIRIAAMLFVLLAGVCVAQAESVPAVKRIASRGMVVKTDKGEAEIPLEISRDWSEPQAQITRALIIIHGKGRDVEGNFDSARRGARTSDASESTLIIAPQFLREVDIPAHRLGPKILRWSQGEWSAGEDAMAPIALSSFGVLDAIVQRLGDRRLFPALQQIVIAGHSAGGQIVQRYAVVGLAPKALPADLHVRFVIANPSSFLYFDDLRPAPGGALVPFPGAAACRRFNRWRYGPRDAPAYVADASFAALEQAYAASDVIYLQGTADNDPKHPDLDTSCAGEAQGANRYERGNAYFHYMQSRHPGGGAQRFWQVPGVAHDASRMFNSECGLAAVFDHGACTTPMH
jgi:pimeloyl-ACP methyl ester carboxylesterase